MQFDDVESLVMKESGCEGYLIVLVKHNMKHVTRDFIVSLVPRQLY